MLDVLVEFGVAILGMISCALLYYSWDQATRCRQFEPVGVRPYMIAAFLGMVIPATVSTATYPMFIGVIVAEIVLVLCFPWDSVPQADPPGWLRRKADVLALVIIGLNFVLIHTKALSEFGTVGDVVIWCAAIFILVVGYLGPIMEPLSGQSLSRRRYEGG